VDRFLHGYLSVNKFCNELAKEWASLPVVDGPKKGRSYYAGDGLNAAGVDVEPFVAVVQSLRPKMQPAGKPPAYAPQPTPSMWESLVALIRGMFGKEQPK
jgi:hypothetical protein